MVEDKHVIETLGKVRVVIENGEITEVGESEVKYCPMFHAMHKVDELNEEFIRKNINFRINDFGMCTPERIVEMDDAVTVGISEILKTNMEKGNIDCVVGACDGAGTVIMTNPRVVQGVGGRVSGLVSTTPIPEVIKKLEDKDSIVLNPETAELDQLEGLKIALDKGYKNIAVTILPSPMVKEIRDYPIDDDVNIYIFVAHTTGAEMDEVKMLFDNADIVTACASKAIDEYADKYGPYYYGVKVPIFCASEDGRRLLDVRLEHIGKPLTTNDYPRNKDDAPHKLI
jgi:putative methanogenesis marker protein 8